jgi:hypothetical protein
VLLAMQRQQMQAWLCPMTPLLLLLLLLGH